MAYRCVRTGFTLVVDGLVTHSDLFWTDSVRGAFGLFACGMARDTEPMVLGRSYDAVLAQDGCLEFSSEFLKWVEKVNPFAYPLMDEGRAYPYFVTHTPCALAMRLHGVKE